MSLTGGAEAVMIIALATATTKGLSSLGGATAVLITAALTEVEAAATGASVPASSVVLRGIRPSNVLRRHKSFIVPRGGFFIVKKADFLYNRSSSVMLV